MPTTIIRPNADVNLGDAYQGQVRENNIDYMPPLDYHWRCIDDTWNNYTYPDTVPTSPTTYNYCNYPAATLDGYYQYRCQFDNPAVSIASITQIDLFVAGYLSADTAPTQIIEIFDVGGAGSLGAKTFANSDITWKWQPGMMPATWSDLNLTTGNNLELLFKFGGSGKLLGYYLFVVYLVLTYISGWSKKIYGLSNSSISKVYGVPKANIKKIYGV